MPPDLRKGERVRDRLKSLPLNTGLSATPGVRPPQGRKAEAEERRSGRGVPGGGNNEVQSPMAIINLVSWLMFMISRRGATTCRG